MPRVVELDKHESRAKQECGEVEREVVRCLAGWLPALEGTDARQAQALEWGAWWRERYLCSHLEAAEPLLQQTRRGSCAFLASSCGLSLPRLLRREGE